MEERFVGISCDTIVEKKNEILLGKRLGKIGSGTWSLPGGKLRFGERIEDCARRELEEETGIKAEEIEWLGVVNDREALDNSHFVKFVYLVTKFSGEMKVKEPEKCERWEWFDKDNLPEPLFYGHIKLLELYKNKQKIIDR